MVEIEKMDVRAWKGFLKPREREKQGNVFPSSVTRLGDFRKFLSANFLIKVVQIFGNFLGYFEVPKTLFNKKLLLLLFGPVLEILG